MTVPSYPLVLPTSPTNFVTTEWSLSRAIGITESPFTYSQQVSEFGGCKWSAVVTLPPMNRATASEWTVFFAQLHGQRGTFLLGDSDAKTIRGSATGTMRVVGAHAIGVYSVAVDGISASQSTAFKKGDYVQFGSGATAKLHIITADISSSATGTATLQIEPPLKTALANDETVVYENTVAVMRMDTSELGWKSNQNSIYGFTFACSEAI